MYLLASKVVVTDQVVLNTLPVLLQLIPVPFLITGAVLQPVPDKVALSWVGQAPVPLKVRVKIT